MERVLYECGDLLIDPGNRRLTRAGSELAIEPKAFAVLVVLVARPDELVTRDELLDAVWGHRFVTPATLNRVMGLLRRAFADDADHPHMIRTVHGSGYRFIGAVRCIAVSREPARAYFGPPPIARLPAKLEPLIGRRSELDRLATMLAERRAVTIIGSGGMGKTQCALEAARNGAELFPDGVWFFDLSALERAQEWLTALAAALSVPTAGTAQLLPRVATALMGRRALLVVDNCDRLATEVGTIELALLRACPELKVLATSQQRLDFVGESLMWLPPLALPPPASQDRRLALQDIAATAAVQLLLTRAVAVQPAIELGPTNAADIVEICRRLDGMPLALELAAAQFATLSPADIRARLEKHVGLLASDSVGREPRHQTLQALVNWSYGLLSAKEQLLLCWLGVFLQGWTIDAAEQIGNAIGIEGSRLLELHSALILKSMVVADLTLSPPRYRLLETMREFALQLLRARHEEAQARTAHLAFFVQLAERSHREILEYRGDAWLERMRHEHANIDAALGWARAAGADPRSALRLVGALLLYGKSLGLYWLLPGWIEGALEGIGPEPSPMYLRALLGSGVFAMHTNAPATELRLTQAVTLAAQLGDRWAHGCAAVHLALWNANLGQLERASADAVVAGELAESQADDWLRSLAALAKGWIAIGSHEPRRAIFVLQPLRRVGFDTGQHLMIDTYLALAHYCIGQWQEAAGLLLDVLDLSLRMRNLRAYAAVLEGGAYLAMRTSQAEACARLLGKAADIRERTRAPLFSFWLAHHDEAVRLALDGLGSARFDGLYANGARARDELVMEEAMALLRDVADGNAPPQRRSA